MTARAHAVWSFSKPRLRAHALGLTVAGVVLALALVAYLSTPAAWRPGSDGYYSYVYARSLAFDGDLNFTNDYRLCGDPFKIGQERVAGRPDNIFYFGPALFWTPILLLMRALGASGDGCGPPWTFVCLLLAPFLAACASFVSYRFVARWFSPGVSAAAVGVTFFGGPVLLCAAGLPSYAHVYELFLSSLVCFAGSALADHAGKKRVAVVALALAALITHRISNVTFILLPFAALAGSANSRRERLLAALGVALGALIGCAVQGAINTVLYGSALTFSHGPHFLSLANAHPWLTLFDAEEGLFFFWPTVWLSLLGFALLRRPELRLTVLALACIAVIELVVDSSALDWAPARRFLKLAPIFSLLAAYPLEKLSGWLSRRPERWPVLAAAAMIAPLAAWSTGLTWGAPRRVVELGTPLRQKQLYGGGVTGFWQLVDSGFGTLPIFPAERWFAARYGLPGTAFGSASHARWYVRDFRTLRWLSREIDLALLTRQHLTEGLTVQNGDVVMTESEARAVFSTQWPHVTHVRLSLQSPAPQRLAIGFGSATGVEWIGAQDVDGATKLSFGVEHLKLGSGLQELYFRLDSAATGCAIRSLAFDDVGERTALTSSPGPRSGE